MSILSKAFGGVNKFILKYPGLAGTPFYIFFAQAAATVGPGATLTEIAGQFYGVVVDATVDSFIPGSAILLESLYKAGAPLFSAVFNGASGAAGAAVLAADFSPGV